MAPARYPSDPVDPAPLGQPLTFEFSGLTAKNRFMKAAMTERLATWDARVLETRGVPTPELINVYRRWGEGGYGVILTGNVMFEYDHLESAGNAIVPVDAPFAGPRFDAFRDLAAAAKKHGSLVVAQLGHPGRQVPEAIQPHPISASDVQLQGNPLGISFAKPRPMDKKDIERVVDGFAHAAEYMQKAGYDGVQLHAAHGYLLAQFLADTTNKRTDEYGGPLLNRARIILEIADAIKARTGGGGDKAGARFSLGIKLNSVEFQQGGFGPDDCGALCEELERHGFDHVELSGGTYEALAFVHKRESSRQREAFFLDFADRIAPRLRRTRAYVVGGLRSAGAMVRALDTVDGVSLARPVAHEFDLPNKILAREVTSAIQNKLDDQDFGSTNVAAGTQIRLVGQDKEPLDLSQDKHLDVFKQSMQKWGQAMADNKDGSKFGFVDVEGLELQGYGTPYLA